MFKRIRHFIGKRILVARLLYPEFKLLIQELGSFDITENQKKFKENLIMQAHIIEKGLSLKNTRVGFGVPKIRKLLQDLSIYYEKYSDKKTLYFILSIIEAYLSFNERNGECNVSIVKMFKELQTHLCVSDDDENLCGGTVQLSKRYILENSKIDYESFIKSRHSIRQFTGGNVPISVIKKALEIAEYTPSACNRQPWKNFIFTNRDTIIKILDVQTGARQFKNDISCLILVTSSINAFSLGEHHQVYVNGGLYAMNLILALHSLGLGVIPLNMGIMEERLIKISSICKLDSSDIPILLIAVGQIPDQLVVAKSCRFPYTDYSIFDQ